MASSTGSKPKAQPSGAALQGGSGDNEKQTPRALWLWADRRYEFTYDAAASHNNALCRSYSTVEGTFRADAAAGLFGHRGHRKLGDQNGLERSWAGLRVWCNPPYGRGVFRDFINKFYDERNEAAIIVGLIKWDPSTDLARFVRTFCDVTELPRIKYQGEDNFATFASALVVVRPDIGMIPRA